MTELAEGEKFGKVFDTIKKINFLPCLPLLIIKNFIICLTLPAAVAHLTDRDRG